MSDNASCPEIRLTKMIEKSAGLTLGTCEASRFDSYSIRTQTADSQVPSSHSSIDSGGK